MLMENVTQIRGRATGTDQPDQQVERFRKIARELGCDEDEAPFDEKLRQIAWNQPENTTRAGKPQDKKREG
jgi:hypothetical protein